MRYTAFGRMLADRPFAFHPLLAKVSGGGRNGLFLNALCHWGFGKTAAQREGWFYQTVKGMTDQTGLTDNEQRSAREELVNLGVIDAERRGHGRVWWYRVNVEKIATLVEALDESELPDPQDPQDHEGGNDEAGEAVELGELPPAPMSPQALSLYRKNGDNGSYLGKTEMLMSEKPSKEPFLSLENRDPLTVNSNTVKPTVNARPAVAQGETGQTQPKKDRRVKPSSLVTGIRNGAKNKGRDYIPVHLRELSDAFITAFRPPLPKEENYWIKGFQDQYDMGLKPADLTAAVEKMTREGLTIKSPESVSAVAWDLHRRNGSNPNDTVEYFKDYQGELYDGLNLLGRNRE